MRDVRLIIVAFFFFFDGITSILGNLASLNSYRFVHGVFIYEKENYYKFSLLKFFYSFQTLESITASVYLIVR